MDYADKIAQSIIDRVVPIPAERTVTLTITMLEANLALAARQGYRLAAGVYETPSARIGW